MGRVPGWFKGLLVRARLEGYSYLTKGKASDLAYRWFGKRVSVESVARYIRWAVEEGYLTPRRGRGGRGVYCLTGKVDALIEVRGQDVFHPLVSNDPFTL